MDNNVTQTPPVPQKDGYGFTRFLYILEAAFEYFTAILVDGAYIAKVTQYMGIPDSITGIITAFVSLGFSFQLVALFLVNKRPVKRWVTVLHITNQLLFSLVYFVSIISFEQYAKITIFVIVLLSAHAINNVVQSPKISWYMEMVDDKKRGSFTATKEIVSLISGLVLLS